MLEENKIKRFIRNGLAAILAYILILSGAITKAKKQCFGQEKILSAFFHNPPEKLFKACILWLKKNGFVFISTEQLIDFLYQKEPLPASAVWITFDDGWRKNLTQVIPIIEKYNVPVTFFIPTVNNVERQKIVKKIYSPSNKPAGDADPMSIADIREIAELPQVTIGSHTANHVVTINCEPGELEQEIKMSKATLQKWLGKEIKSFAYPNGDYNGREKEFLQKYGYQLAATIENNYITPNTDPFFVPRNCVLDDGSFAENLCHMLGVWTPFIEKLKKLLSR